MRCVSGSKEALHSDGKPERIEKVSIRKACVDGAARTGFPGTATKLASKDAGGFEGTRIRKSLEGF
jgi:hypothetical protein